MDEKCVVDPQRDCLGLAKAAVLEARIANLEDWQKDSKRFHNDFYDWQRQQIGRDAKTDERLKTIDGNINKNLIWQESQQRKPQTFLDDIKKNVVWAFIGAMIVFILGQVGL